MHFCSVLIALNKFLCYVKNLYTNQMFRLQVGLIAARRTGRLRGTKVIKPSEGE